jgi:hypothetical protein
MRTQSRFCSLPTELVNPNCARFDRIPAAPFAVSGRRGDTDWPWRGELHTLGFILLPLSAIFRASNPKKFLASAAR